MRETQEHYDGLLAEHYTWMAGGMAARLAENEALFQRLDVRPRQNALAVDLGAGPGFQAIPLARAGFKVFAFDLSSRLLSELEQASRGLRILTIKDDLRQLAAHVQERFELAVCMGDTLTHLPSLEAVEGLFATVAAGLLPGGDFVVTFRDLTRELTGTDRFFAVRSEPDRIFSCFLDYRPDHVMVHDYVYVRTPQGAWELRKSCYPKLRLGADAVVAALGQAGLTVRVRETTASGMVLVTARRS